MGDLLNNSKEDITTKFNFISNLLNKATRNNPNFDMLNTCCDQIENELNEIKLFEEKLSNRENLKGKIQKASEIIKKGKSKQEEFTLFEEKVNSKEMLLEEINQRILRNKEKEKYKESNGDSKKEIEIKERIKDLKVILLCFYSN